MHMRFHYALDVNVYRMVDAVYVEYWHEKTGVWRQTTTQWTGTNFSGPLWTDSIEELLELWSHDPRAVKCILRLV